jgi:hypothetical protein
MYLRGNLRPELGLAIWWRPFRWRAEEVCRGWKVPITFCLCSALADGFAPEEARDSRMRLGGRMSNGSPFTLLSKIHPLSLECMTPLSAVVELLFESPDTVVGLDEFGVEFPWKKSSGICGHTEEITSESGLSSSGKSLSDMDFPWTERTS